MAEIAMDVLEETPQEEVVQPQDHETQDSQDTQEHPSQVEDNSKEYNFKQLRDVNKQLEERLKAYEEQLERTQTQSNSESKEEEWVGEDDLVEGRHLKNAISKIENLLRAKELETVPDKLTSKFSDFDQVVTKENLEHLKKNEPELFYSIQSGDSATASGLYAKGVAAYKTLKSLGLSPGAQDIMKQKDTVKSNHSKPLSTQAIKGSGALEQANMFANGLTPELKNQLLREMNEAAKGI